MLYTRVAVNFCFPTNEQENPKIFFGYGGQGKRYDRLQLFIAVRSMQFKLNMEK